MIYSDRLKELRENSDLKQHDLANFLHIDRATYGQFEREYSIMPIIRLNDICNFFNISLDYIFSFSNIKKYSDNREKIDKVKVGERLKEFRKEKKLTQVKLAEILNTAQPVIANYEKGINLISTPFLYEICKKYNISADYLLGKIDSPKYLK